MTDAQILSRCNGNTLLIPRKIVCPECEQEYLDEDGHNCPALNDICFRCGNYKDDIIHIEQCKEK